MRILVDMNLTFRWVRFLEEADYPAVHWSTVGSPTSADDEICDYARLHGYVLLTNDLDFPQILAHTHRAAPSVILLRGEPLVPETRGEVLLRAVLHFKQELTEGAILTLDWSDHPRAKLLPLP
jgi:predicted nuclease of predicted toxin-antitoxin system